MSGFIVNYRPSSDSTTPNNSTAPDLSDLGITIEDAGVERITTRQNNIALIDGYALGISLERVAAALESHDDEFLSRIHGNYCALVIHRSGEMWGFCDRFGAKTLYWQKTGQHGFIISSRWDGMPIFDQQWDDIGLGETLHYRWMSGQQTLLTSISKLPHWHRVSFSLNGE